MDLKSMLGGEALDFTLPSLGLVVPDDGCSSQCGVECSGGSTCINDAGADCPSGHDACSESTCTETTTGSCGGATCATNR